MGGRYQGMSQLAASTTPTCLGAPAIGKGDEARESIAAFYNCNISSDSQEFRHAHARARLMRVNRLGMSMLFR